MFLSRAEIIELTHKKSKSAQVRALRGMGIDHKIRPDGTVAVSRSYIEKIFGVSNPESDRIKRKTEPNWSALDA